ncbi:pentapeptide repeat-containing protein [Pseudomonas sp. PDM12]|uniref:pentapeptide repeat-containing protein n=1 Tax=Pseudomonas sp. PDM12 TaxID=2769260 RepID=UPI00177E3125|nr:pentapeptide repeat-containing protein [Pseudomonas sp. PDM12]MBD9653760.1 pentapeptide repeat-containing protein [Pseudomonas sp. PDM12]
MLENSGRTELKDQKFTVDISSQKYMNFHFVRLVAKGKEFKCVDFKYSTFEACYLRNCKFDSCNFTGCRFIGTNLHGAIFSGCTFDYATFERTDINNEVLSSNCPSSENLKIRFARSLRMNYQQLGDALSVNKSIGVELEATKEHLYKSWHSNESYYRKKYRSWNRAQQFFLWINFKILDLLWGNGESAWKLARAVLVVLALMTIFDVFNYRAPYSIDSYLNAFILTPQVFLGTAAQANFPSYYITVVTFVRLVLFGFFMAIIVKRFNRR